MDIRDEISKMFKGIKPRGMSVEVRVFLAGWITGCVQRHRAAERERVLAWLAKHDPQLVQEYREQRQREEQDEASA